MLFECLGLVSDRRTYAPPASGHESEKRYLRARANGDGVFECFDLLAVHEYHVDPELERSSTTQKSQ